MQQSTAENYNLSPIRPKSMVSIKLHSVTYLTIFFASAGHQSVLLGELIGSGYMLMLTYVSTDVNTCQRHTDTHKHRQTNHLLVRFTQSDLIVKMLLWYGW